MCVYYLSHLKYFIIFKVYYIIKYLFTIYNINSHITFNFFYFIYVTYVSLYLLSIYFLIINKIIKIITTYFLKY